MAAPEATNIEDASEKRDEGSCCSPVPFMKNMIADIDQCPPEGNGKTFTIWLAAMYIGLKGFYSQFTTSSTTFFLRDILLLDSVRVSEIGSFRKLPWSMKPGFAFVSDLVPIFGYRKQRYVFVYALLGMTSSILVVFVPARILTGPNGSANFAALCFFFSNMYVSGVDILTQGRYTVLIKTVGASILTFVFVCANTAQMTVLATIGYLNEINPRIPLTLAMPFGVAMFFFAALNFMGDLKSDVYCGIEWGLLRQYARPMLLACVQMVCTAGLMTMTLWSDYRDTLGEYFRLYWVIFFSILIISGAFWAMPRTLAKVNAYLYLCKIMQLSAGGAMTFFYTKPRSGEPCPNTPQFDLVFYQTYTGFADKICTLAGVWLFQNYIRKWNARPAFWVTTFFTIVAGIFDIIMVERWNIDWGISDRAMYFFGSTCIEGLVETLDELPGTLIISQLAPKDIETTTYAILIANTNLGGTISSFIGTDAQRWLGVKYSSGTPPTCNNPNYTFAGLEFTGLSWILIIGDIILPLLTIPLTWLLIPGVPLESDMSNIDGDVRETQMTENLNQDPALTSGPTALTAGPTIMSGDTGSARFGLQKGQSAVTDQSDAENLVLTSAFMRHNTRQNDADML